MTLDLILSPVWVEVIGQYFLRHPSLPWRSTAIGSAFLRRPVARSRNSLTPTCLMIFILTLVVTRSHIVSEGDEARDEAAGVVEMAVGAGFSPAG